MHAHQCIVQHWHTHTHLWRLWRIHFKTFIVFPFFLYSTLNFSYFVEFCILQTQWQYIFRTQNIWQILTDDAVVVTDIFRPGRTKDTMRSTLKVHWCIHTRSTRVWNFIKLYPICCAPTKVSPWSNVRK